MLLIQIYLHFDLNMCCLLLIDTYYFSDPAFVIFILLGSLNSCCNPWIYLAFSGNFIQQIIPCWHRNRLQHVERKRLRRRHNDAILEYDKPFLHQENINKKDKEAFELKKRGDGGNGGDTRESRISFSKGNANDNANTSPYVTYRSRPNNLFKVNRLNNMDSGYQTDGFPYRNTKKPTDFNEEKKVKPIEILDDENQLHKANAENTDSPDIIKKLSDEYSTSQSCNLIPKSEKVEAYFTSV